MSGMMPHRPKFARLLAILVAISMLSSCASSGSRQGDGQRYPKRSGGGLSSGEMAGIVGGGLLFLSLAGALISKAMAKEAPKPKDAQSTPPDPTGWASLGPAVPAAFLFSNLVVSGYVQGNWPVAIDYQLESPGSVQVVVSAEGVAPFVQALDGSKTDRQLTIFQLPEQFGPTGRQARVEIHATDSGEGYEKLLPLRIFGLAAGPWAVGSIGIDQIEFGPTRIQVSQGQLASYSFYSHKNFGQVVAEFRRVENRGGVIRADTLVNHQDVGSVPEQKAVGKDGPPRTWDGQTAQKQASIGLHQLQIRAWYNDSNPDQQRKDWVVSWSPDWVEVKE